MNTVAVAMAAESADQVEKAAVLARRLKLPLVEVDDAGHPFLLVVAASRLEIRQTGAHAPGPVFVDFTEGAVDYRRKHGGGRKQPLARAVGIKGKSAPTVFDATAGLGRDAFVLACLGCRVHLFERSPLVGVMLEDGLNRAMADPEIDGIVRDRMTLSIGDSNELIALLVQEKPEVVYLDPMYPHRTKSALVKKEMRLLRAIVGDDPDAPQLLETALKHAMKRVVVKRPRLARPITGPEPSLQITGKNSRFDVYLVPQ